MRGSSGTAEATLQDIAGEANENEPAYDRVAFRFRTEEARAPQFDALVEDFASAENIDFEAAFLEPLAEIGPGSVRGAPVFPGSETARDYHPRSPEVLLNTDFTQITPVNGVPFDVAGGVFEFRNVTIPRGVRVTVSGTKSMIWRVTGDFVVEGELDLSGGPGQSVSFAFNPRPSAYGGVASCGGGSGGRSSPVEGDTSRQGEDGFGAYQEPGGGGIGGAHSCTRLACVRGGGGGGGSFATQGDPHYYLAWLGTPPGLPTVGLGRGGRMCGGTPPTGPQAPAGALAFFDTRADNDFWGSGVDMRRGLRIAGELLVPRGGAGGGGGGDSGLRCPPNSEYYLDSPGGGGGGGGGAILVQALGRVVIRANGVIRASGGNGGGGAEAGTNGNAGGGGGGSGGMVVLMAAGGIHIAAHGDTYSDGQITGNATGAYDFAVEADGGIGVREPFQGNWIGGKYPGRGGPDRWQVFDVNPIGGFGGMGLVQFMTAPGENRSIHDGGDGTNTRLDDHVFFYPDDARLDEGLASPNPHAAAGPAFVGLTKMRYLGWRGLIDEHGVGRDDLGEVVTLPRGGHGEGDIRPAPILLPVPFGPLSRLRSRWIDTGATARREDPTGNEPAARTFVPYVDPREPTNPFTNLLAGPTYVFGGTVHEAGEAQGYVRYRQTPSGVEREVQDALPVALLVAAVTAEASWRGQPAYRVDLQSSSPLLAPRERYVGYRAVLQAQLGEPLDSYGIVWHDDRSLLLSPDAGPLPDRAVGRVQVQADFFGLAQTDGETFRTSRFEQGRRVPTANVRIGFAFHVQPSRPRMVGARDWNRVPRDPTAFLHSLDRARPDVMRELRELGKAEGRTEGATAVQYDLLFNAQFSELPPGYLGSAAASAPRPVLHWLVLPFQF